MISPINVSVQQQVVAEVERYRQKAADIYQQSFPAIPVRFDLKGKTAGMYRVRMSASKGIIRRALGRDLTVPVEKVIRFNPWLFAKYPEDSWANTVPHEVAHYIVDCLYGMRTIRPHGKEWQSVMANFGAPAVVRANYDLSDIPVRQVKRYTYQCQCREVLLSSYRHRKIINGLQRYRCRDCAADLTYSES